MGVKDIISGLAKLSPTIGAAVGGPVGGAIGTGIAAAAQMITGQSDPNEIVQALTADPNKLLELEQHTRDLEIEELRIHAADRESARSMQARLAEAKHGSAWAQPILSLVVTVGFFGMLAIVLDMQKDAIPEVAFIMLGTLAGGFSQVLTYWLGSSRGSKEKTELMASFVKR